MILRQYQKECIETIDSHGDGAWLCQLATGLGKTVIFSRIPRYGRMLVLAHREELVRQPVKYFDVPVGIEMADSQMGNEDVVCASVQTLSRRLNRFPRDIFHTIVIDECHHAAASTYQKILTHFNPKRILGFTATPNRSDGIGLECAFDKIIFERNLKWGIENGYLSNIECKRLNIGYDLSKVAVWMGDYAPGDLERVVNVDSCNHAIAEAVKNIAEFPCLIFAVDVAHAEALAKYIPGAVALSAKSKNRSEVINAYKQGDIPVLINCALFTEGTDLPNTRTVIIARPTKSNALYTQMVGRGTRLHDGKGKCLLIDCVGISNMPICTAPSLLGLDLDAVPLAYQKDIEGDLLADIPAVIEQKSDTPESWINNVKIVNLWAKANAYTLHDVNWIKLSDGSMRIRLPAGHKKSVWMTISAPDLTGYSVFETSGGYATRQPTQKCYDFAYDCLRTQFSDCHPLWSLSSSKRWGASPANEKQLEYINRLSSRKKIDVSNVLTNITKLQAAQLIERMKG